MTYESASDEELARATADGSVDAFDVLARRYQVPLLRFIARRFRHAADAEDVCQETFVRAFGAIETFDTRRSFRPWLFSIAFRQGVTAVRREQVRRTDVLAEDDRLPGRSAMSGEGEEGDLWSVARRLLSAEQSSALWLVHVESMPIVEVAAVLGKTAGSVKVMIHRARERLRDEWLRLEAQHATR